MRLSLRDSYGGVPPVLAKRWLVCAAMLMGLAVTLSCGVYAQEEPAKEAPKSEAVSQPEKSEATESKKAAPEARKPATTSAAKKPNAKAKSAPAVTSARQVGTLPVVSRGPVTMNFRGADIDRILDFYGSILGLTVIKDPALTGTATIIAPKPIPVEQAFEILNAYLDTRGYEAVRENGMLKVRAKQSRGFGGPGTGRRGDSSDPGTGTNPMAGFMPGGGQTTDQQTRVFQLKYAGAQGISRIINELFRDTGGAQQNQQQRIQQVLAQLGQQMGGRPGDQQRAERMRQVISRFAPMMQGMSGLGSARASFDNYSNSVVVTASPKLMEQIQSIIEELDQEITPNLKTEVFTLQYVDCTEMQRVISSLLLATSTGGASSGALRDVPFEMRVMAAARAGTAGAVSGQVVAHQETNSVIVTASPEQLQMVRQVVQKLDVKQELQSTTFVFPLSRASANDVATILSSMFGRRGGAGGFGQFGQTGRFGTQQQVRRRLDQQTGSRTGFGAGSRTGSGFGYTPGFTFRGQAGGGGMMPFSTAPSANPLPVTPSAQSLDGGYNAASMMFRDPYDLAVWGGDEAPVDDLADEQSDTEDQQMLAQFGAGGARTGTSSAARSGTMARTGRGPGGQLSQLADLLNNLIVVPDTNSNSLIISVDPAYVEILQEILQSLDVVPEQVMIEAIIVEATLDDTTKLGFNWQFTNPGVAGPNTSGTGTVAVQPPSLSGGLAYTLVGADFEAVLNALQSDHRFKVLSTPKIFTANNRQAQINISQQVPFITSQFVSPTGSQTTSFGFLDVGIILDVTPRISRNGYVTIDVIQEANEFQGFTAFNAPLVSRRSTQTTVTVKDGQTVVIGGLMKDSETTTMSKVPILGYLPIIGSLFRSKDKTKARTELMVFLTPRVVRTAEESYALTEEQRNQLQMKDKVKISPPPAVEQVVPQVPEAPGGTGPADQGEEQKDKTPTRSPGGTNPGVRSS